MERWEYLVADINWDSAVQLWKTNWTGKRSRAGLDGILSDIGEVGWELVSFAPFAGIAATPRPKEQWNVVSYRAVFKRLKP